MTRKEAVAQLRLFLAERLVLWALRVSPRGHADSLVIEQAALMVAQREPSKPA